MKPQPTPGENMRDEYDFSQGIDNPYVKSQKTTITIRLDSSTVDYFKSLSAEINMPYQTIINSYLSDCALKKKRPVMTWE